MDVTRDQLLALAPHDLEPVQIPGLGRIYLRQITTREREAYEGATWEIIDGKVRARPGERRARLLVLCLARPTGERLFGDADLDAIGQLPAAVTEPLYLAALRINRMDAESLEGALGNFEGARSDGRSSPSLAISG